MADGSGWIPTASEIVSRIEKGEWTASRVLEAYIARAAIAHERTNCLTEGVYVGVRRRVRGRGLKIDFCSLVFFPRARERAAELDAEFAATGKLRGPLHGVPVSEPHCLQILRFIISCRR